MYRNPKPTVDLIIFKKNDIENKNSEIVLIKRRNPPIGWALPGGFIDEGETAEHAALREALEETGLEITLLDLLYVYSNPNRDTRQHNISIVFTATASHTQTPVGMDDASEAQWFTLSNLPSPLAFDHEQIIADFYTFMESGRRPCPAEGR